MVHRGEVVRKEGSRVFVRLERPAECDHCGSCPVSGEGLVECPARCLEVGDVVEMEMPEKELLGLIFLLYLFPALVFFLVFVMTTFLFSETWALPAAFLGLVPAVFFLRRQSRKKSFTPLVRKIESDAPGGNGSRVEG